MRLDKPDRRRGTCTASDRCSSAAHGLDVGGKTYAAGGAARRDFDDFLRGKREIARAVRADRRAPRWPASATRDYSGPERARRRQEPALRADPRQARGGRATSCSACPASAPSAHRVDAATSRTTTSSPSTDYLTPTSLSLGDVGERAGEAQARCPRSSTPAGCEIAAALRHVARTAPVPYFLVSPKGSKLDGTQPTLLYGYGGFEISHDARATAARVGARWLEQGGVYVWPTSAAAASTARAGTRPRCSENRQRAYEDFAAVAEDLIARKVTSPQHLGIMGGSNGGLLMGNMLTQLPGAVRRGRLPGAAAGHEALPQAARRRLVDGRVRRPGRARGVGLHPDASRRTNLLKPDVKYPHAVH